MKGVFVLLDGLGDLPCKELKGKTPLEAAKKTNLNYLASRGKLGRMYSVRENVAPESDSAILSVLGNNYVFGYRGQFEVLGAGLSLKKGDLAVRTNFGTIDNLNKRKIIDRRAGRTLTTSEARILAKAINKNIKLPCKFVFKDTIQHRGVLVFRGGFSDNITNTDPAYRTPGKVILNEKFKFSEPLDEEENSKYTANLLNEFVEQSFQILDKHPVNIERRKKKLLPANIILTRDAESEDIQLKKYKKWASVAYMPLEIGITQASGMKNYSFSYPEMKAYDVYENLYSGLKKACKFARKIIKKHWKKYDYFYIHLKETDVPGHDNKPFDKKYMIDYIDNQLFSFLRKIGEKNKIKILVTGDHSTPCSLKAHSSDPVPVLFCDWSSEDKKEFSEKACKKGKLGKICGKNLLKLFN